MKILMLTDRLALGGAETHIYELIRGLRARGATVEAASAGGAYAERLTKEGVRHHEIGWATRNPLALLAAKRRLTALLQEGGYDLVHAHARLPAFLGEAVCRRMKIPFVTTAHWVFRADGWRRRMSRWGDRTLAVSEDIASYLTEAYGLSPAHITLTRNGIDTETFSPCRHAVGRGRLIHVSRLDEGRAMTAEMLIRLAPRLHACGCESLTVVGDGDRYAHLAAAAEEANRALGLPFIRMTGGVTEIAPLLREADIFIGVSRAALEAMACGLPTILSGDEGYLSVFSPETAAEAEKNNFCCRGAAMATDEQLLSDIRALQADSARQRALGKYGADYVRRRYSASAMVEDAWRVYRDLLSRREKKPPIILCGYYGFDNLGDEAVLHDLLTRLRGEGYERITVLSADPKKTTAHHGVGAASRFSAGVMRSAGREGGLFVLGGGNLLQNETSRRSLFYYTQSMRFAKRCGCRVWVLGGIGRLDVRGERMAARALRTADLCLGRTPGDVARFRRLGGDRLPVRLLPDGALWTRPSPTLSDGLPQGPVILLALHGGTPTGTRLALADACAHLARHEGLSVVLACMHRGQDEATARAVAARIPGARLLPPISAEETVAFLFERCRLVLSTRLHMLIFATVAGVPSVAPDDGGKIRDFAAFVAMCEAEGSGPMLTCLPPSCGRQEYLAATEAALGKRPGKEAHRRFLRRLRAAGEDFSFSACLSSTRGDMKRK